MEGPDNDPLHLYEPFRNLIAATLSQANHESHGKVKGYENIIWDMFEGYRSGLRQYQLYKQGRSWPGNIVTQTSIPDHHGIGLAADIVWWHTDAEGKKIGEPQWGGPDELWLFLFHAGATQGLEVGGRWRFEDYPHLQADHQQYDAWIDCAIHYLHKIGLTTPDPRKLS